MFLRKKWTRQGSLAFLLIVFGLAKAVAACPDGQRQVCPFDGSCFCIPVEGTGTYEFGHNIYYDMQSKEAITPPPPPPPPPPTGSPPENVLNPQAMRFWNSDNYRQSSTYAYFAQGTEASVSNELWIDVFSQPGEQWQGPRPLVFSYVLAGNPGVDPYKGTDNEVLHARKNLDALVSEVRSLEGAVDPNAPSLANANLFCIPTKPPANINGATYSYPLARAYRQKVQELLRNDRSTEESLDHVGPFIVATRRPLNEINRDASQSRDEGNILVVDLSSAEPQTVVIFVKQFKEAVRRSADLADGRLTPLRAILVSALVRINSAVPFITTAYANIKGYSSKSSGKDVKGP